MTTHGDLSLTYDANGNLVAMGGKSLSYDPEDRLTSVTNDDGAVVTMAYDHAGQRRVKRVEGGDSAETIYVDPSYEKRGEGYYRYVWAGAKRVARASANEPSVAGLGLKDFSLSFVRGGSGWGRSGIIGDIENMIGPNSFDFLLLTSVLGLFYLMLLRSNLRIVPALKRSLAGITVVVLLAVTSVPAVTGCSGGGMGVLDSTEEESLSGDSGPQTGVIYYIDDHLGNAHLITDSHGNVLREENRYPYGLERSSGDSSEVDEGLLEGGAAPDYTYTGKEYDEETGLIYFGKRYYHPESGRWVSADNHFLDQPNRLIKMPRENNIYTYGQNNPVNNIDIEGEFACGGFCVAAVVGGAVALKTVGIVKGTQYLSEYVNDKPLGTDSRSVNTALAIGIGVPATTVGAAAVAASAPAYLPYIGTGLKVAQQGYMDAGLRIFEEGMKYVPPATLAQGIVNTEQFLSGAFMPEAPTTFSESVGSLISHGTAIRQYYEFQFEFDNIFSNTNLNDYGIMEAFINYDE